MKGRNWNITKLSDLKSVAREILSEQSAALAPDSGARVLALYGDLGSGKTTFVQVLGELLKIDEVITSPTFVLMKRYKVHESDISSLVHIDAYRLRAPEEIKVLGFHEWLKEEGTLIVLEWADKIEELLPENTARLKFSLKGTERTLELL